MLLDRGAIPEKRWDVPRDERWAQPPLALLNGAVALVCAFFGILAAQAFGPPATPVSLWPPAGIAFAVVYAYGARALPGVILGALVSGAYSIPQVVSSTPDAMIAVVLISLGAALQALLTTILVRAFVGSREPLMRPQRISKFMLLAGVLGPFVNSIVGTWTLWDVGAVSRSQAADVWFTWWIGDAMGVVFFAPIVLMLIPSQAEVWAGRRLKVAIPTFLAVLISLGMWWQGGVSAQDDMRLIAEQRAQVAAVDLEYHANTYLRVAKDAASMFMARPDVSAAEFTRFATPVLLDEEDVLALEWLPWVASGDLDRFQEQLRKDLGMPRYSVWTLNRKPILHTATADVHYAPVAFAATQPEFAPSFGLDLSSSEREYVAIGDALELGAAMTEPFTTTLGVDAAHVVRMVVPVYEVAAATTTTADRWEHLRGFITAVVAVDRLVDETFDHPAWVDAEIVVTDTTKPHQPVDVVRRLRHSNEASAASADGSMELADRTWTVTVIPGAITSGTVNPYSSHVILLLGLLFAGLLESFLLVVTGLERRLERRVERSNYAATHDPLTDLINRREFVERLDMARQRTVETGVTQVLLFVDLDGFKLVNDTGGHAAGDELLRALSVRMRNTVRQADSVARLGGDEFAVLLADCPDHRGLAIADDLVRAVADIAVDFEGQRLGVTASVGFVAINPPEPSSTDELLRQADAACYLAKRSGKSQVRRFEGGVA